MSWSASYWWTGELRSNKPTVAYTPRSDATLEGEMNALASVYKFILDCHSKKEGGSATAPDDAKGSKHDRAKTIIRERP
jgi:hypothetical protein